MSLSIVPSIISRRVVSNAGLHLSVAHDSTCFMTYFELYKVCLENAWAIGGAINQISSSSFEWWSSFICNVHVTVFRDVVWPL